MKDKILSSIFIIILCSFAVFIRIQAIKSSHFDDMARQEVYRDNLDTFRKKIDQKYQNFPEYKKDSIILAEHKRYMEENKAFINDKIREKAKEKKEFYQNDSGHAYIFGIDSYYWLRLMDNLIKKGHIGDKVVNGKEYDVLTDAPIEDSLKHSMHIKLGGLIYKVLAALKLNACYESGLYIIPILFSILLVIVSFWVVWLLSGSNYAAFWGALAINFSPLLLQRALGEWLDTDIYNVFFPLLIFGIFLYAFNKKTDTSRGVRIGKVLIVLVFSFSCSLYASVWQGWWYIFDLLMICAGIFILNDFYETKEKAVFRENIIWLFLLFFCTLFSVAVLNGKEGMFSFFTEPRKLLSALKSVPQDNWPNVFLTVAELSRVSPYRIVQELGSVWGFFLAILGSIYLVVFKKVIRERKTGMGFFCLFVWLGALYYTSLSAIRFALLLVVPVGIMFGITLEKLIRKVFILSLKFSKKVHFLILGCLVFIVYGTASFYITSGWALSRARTPIMNDAWYKSLEYLKKNSGSGAIINSWWDYGHWFTAIAQRKVMFDGKTQNSPVAYWIAKALMNKDEEEAVGILRMLNISKNKAFDLLESFGLNHRQAIKVLNDVIKLPQEEAVVYLEKDFGKDKAKEITRLIFSPDLPEAYLIVSFDMIDKMSAISHIGNWDFQRGDIWTSSRFFKGGDFLKYLKKEYGYDKEEANKLLWEIGVFNNEKEAIGWISHVNRIYRNSLSGKFKKSKDLLVFDNNLALDLSTYGVYVSRGKNVDIGIPYSVVYMKDGLINEKINEDSNLEYSVLLAKQDDAYTSVFLDKEINQSMFVRMYFLGGEGLKYFKKAHEEKTPDGDYVYVYKIEWPEAKTQDHKATKTQVKVF